MDRNLHRRIETLFPIKDEKLLRHLRDDVLDLYLRENVKARETAGGWVLCADRRTCCR